MQKLGAIRKRITRPNRRLVVVMIAVLAATTTALATAGSVGAQTGGSPGVTAKAIKVGYIYSEGGLAGSTFAHADDGFNARIKAENAKGGVNGRKIDPVLVNDSGTQ